MPAAVYAGAVCLSVCHKSEYTAKRTIKQTTLYDSSVRYFWRQRSWWNFNGVTPTGAPNTGGGKLKSAIFGQCLAISQKRCTIDTYRSCCGRLLGTPMRFIDWRHFQWAWVTLNYHNRFLTKITSMSVLFIVGPNCTLVASHATLGESWCRWDRWPDGRQTVALRFPLAATSVIKYLLHIQVGTNSMLYRPARGCRPPDFR